jgi:cyclopropane fatty-acyl-phospholipid synthase-like methyltransferase
VSDRRHLRASTATFNMTAARCRVCGGAARIWVSQAQRDLVRCRACGLAWVPQGVMRSGQGGSIYEDDPTLFFAEGADYYLDESAREAADAKLRWILQFAEPGGALLDVGANVGYLVQRAATRYRATGIDPSSAAVEWARRMLGAAVEVGSIYDRREDFLDRFDVVTMFDVIEHLPDPGEALARCREYLSERGRLFLTTPDTGSPAARVLGKHWYYIDLMEHVTLFNKANLARLLDARGLRVVARRTFGRRYRFSYVVQRLRYLGQASILMRLAYTAALPLRLWPEARVALNLGDVMGVVAERGP